MKVIVLAMIFWIQNATAGCEQYYRTALFPRHLLSTNAEKQNIWSIGFNPEYFLKKNADLNIVNFMNDIRIVEERTPTFEENIRRLLGKLLEAEKITPQNYQRYFNQISQNVSRKNKVLRLTGLPNIRPYRTGRIKNAILYSKIADAQMDILETSLRGLNIASDRGEKLVHYMSFINTLDADEVPLAIHAISELYSSSPQNALIKKFIKLENKVNTYNNKRSLALNDQYRSRLTAAHLANRVMGEAAISTERYRTLVYSCRNRDYISTDAIAGAKRLSTVFPAVTGASTAYGYLSEHWNEERTSRWYRGLAFEVFLETFLVWVNTKITMAHGLGFVQRSFQSYRASAAIDIFDSIAYQVIVGDPETIANNPEEAAQIQAVVRDLESNNAHVDFIAQLKSVFSTNTNDAGAIHENDLENPDLANIIFEYLANQANQISSMDYEDISKSSGYKRFMFNRKWEIGAVPTAILINNLIYNVLCMAPLNYRTAITQTILITLAYDFIMSKFYYSWRNEETGT